MFFASQVAHCGFDVERQIAHHCSSKNKKLQKGETKLEKEKIRKAKKIR